MDGKKFQKFAPAEAGPATIGSSETARRADQGHRFRKFIAGPKGQQKRYNFGRLENSRRCSISHVPDKSQIAQSLVGRKLSWRAAFRGARFETPQQTSV